VEYFTAVVALLTCIAGVVGNTWDKRKRGLHRITRSGWVVLGCGSLALIAAVIQIHSRETTLRDAQVTRSRYLDQAYADLEDALMEIDGAFSSLYDAYLSSIGRRPVGTLRDIYGNMHAPEDSARWWNHMNPVGSGTFYQYLASLDMNEAPESDSNMLLLHGESWARYLARKFRRAHEDVQTVLLAYGPVLPKDDLLAVDSLRTTDLLRYVCDLEQAYSRKDIAGFFPVIRAPHLAHTFIGVRSRLIPHNRALVREQWSTPPSNTVDFSSEADSQ
jgi:hypothetical protein